MKIIECLVHWKKLRNGYKLGLFLESLLKLISCNSFVSLCKEFIDSGLESNLSSRVGHCGTELGKHLLVLLSFLYSLYLVYSLVRLWFWYALGFYIKSRLLLLLVVILVIDSHWYVSHTSKFIDVSFESKFKQIIFEFQLFVGYRGKFFLKENG